jgi:hypothetical protein
MEIALQREYRYSGPINNQKCYNDPLNPLGLTKNPSDSIERPRKEAERDKPKRQDPTEQNRKARKSDSCTEGNV